jgi:hypothetical protein
MTLKVMCVSYVRFIFEFTYFIIIHMHFLKILFNLKLFLLQPYRIQHTVFCTVSLQILTI